MLNKKCNGYFLVLSHYEWINLQKKTDVDMCNNYSLGLLCGDMNVNWYINKLVKMYILVLFSF